MSDPNEEPPDLDVLKYLADNFEYLSTICEDLNPDDMHPFVRRPAGHIENNKEKTNDDDDDNTILVDTPANNVVVDNATSPRLSGGQKGLVKFTSGRISASFAVASMVPLAEQYTHNEWLKHQNQMMNDLTDYNGGSAPNSIVHNRDQVDRMFPVLVSFHLLDSPFPSSIIARDRKGRRDAID